MEPSDIAVSYGHIARHWASDAFNHKNGIPQHERAIAFLKHRGTALDIGCGCSGRFVQLLREHGFVPEGVDISKEMTELAQARAPEVVFHCADICEWHFPKQYDFITAWDSIFHLSIERQERVIAKVSAGLQDDGVFIFSAGGVDESDEHTDSFLGQNFFYGAIGIPGLLRLLHDCGLALRHFEFDQWPYNHLCVIVQKTGSGATP